MNMSKFQAINPSARSHFPAFIPIFILIIIIVISPWATYTQIAFLTTPITISIAILFIATLPYHGFSKSIISIYKYDTLLIFFAVIITLSYFGSLYSNSWAQSAFWYSACMVTYISTRSFFTKTDYLLTLSYAAIAGIIVTFPLISLRVNEYGILSDRQAVPDHNSNFTAYCLCALTFIILLDLVLNKRSALHKIACYAAITLSVYEIILLGTRGALISVILLCIFYFFHRFVGPATYRAFAFLFIAVSALTAVGMLETPLTWMDSFSTRSDGELSGRSPSWDVARAYFLNHPFLGVGAGAFQFLNPLQIGVHNTALALALDTGILGIAALFAWVTLNFAHIKLKDPRKSQMAALWMAYALPISLSGEWIQSPLVWVTFGILFGIEDPSELARELP